MVICEITYPKKLIFMAILFKSPWPLHRILICIFISRNDFVLFIQIMIYFICVWGRI